MIMSDTTLNDSNETMRKHANSENQAPENEDASVAELASKNNESELMELKKLVDSLTQKEKEAQESWLRAKAEVENIRRRAQEEINKNNKFAVESFASNLLGVKDSLEAALSNQDQSTDAMKEGIETTLKQLSGVFRQSHIQTIEPDTQAGEKFNPDIHQAITQKEEEGEPNRVVEVLQKGYQLYERVLRPALVVVSVQKK